MKDIKYYIGLFFIAILLMLTIPYAWKLITIVFMSKNVSVLQQLMLYKWAAVGAIVFLVLKMFIHKNIEWFETFTHELTHTIVALLFLRRIHSFNANEGTGVVYTSGNVGGMTVPMSLAPYCLPIYTYLLLAIRCIIDINALWIYDIFVGATISFHIICFINQTGRYQTDINQYPLSFSYLYIHTARLINICIISVAFFPQYNIFTSLWRYLQAIFNNLLSLFTVV